MATSLIDFNALRPNAAMEAYQQGQQNQLAQMQLAQQQQAIRDAEAEREAYKGAATFGEVSQRLMKQGLGKQALAVSAAEAKQRADKIALLKDTTALMENTAKQIMNSPEAAEALVTRFGQQTGHDVTAELAQFQAARGNPEKVKEIAAGYALKASELLPKFETRNLGATTERQGYNPITGAAIGPATVYKNTVSPDAAARIAQAGATGTWSPDSIDLAANMYLTTGAMPPVGQGAAAMGIRDKILNRAVQLQTNPNAPAAPGAVDTAATIAGAKVDTSTKAKAQRDFATGIQGQQVTAFNTAVDHLETMDKLVTALDNKDTRAINTLGNMIAKQTGQAAPTNFDTARRIVGAEIQKAIIRAGGTGEERKEAAAAFETASSPEQLRGAINTYKDLMGGQLKSLQLQYEQTTGRKDFANRLTGQSKATLSAHGGQPAPAAGNTVSLPDGKVMTFPTPEAAAQFKKAAGL